MKNLLKLPIVFLLLLLVAVGCKNPFAKNEPKIVEVSPSPTSSSAPTVSSAPTPSLDIDSTPPPDAGRPLNNKATILPKPAYPSAARAVRASGAVNVEVEVDENGYVTSAKAVSGHPLLRQAAEQAAREAKFKASNKKTNGIIVYNFTP